MSVVILAAVQLSLHAASFMNSNEAFKTGNLEQTTLDFVNNSQNRELIQLFA